MKLRRLEEKDAPWMLEWMHDDSVVHDMGTDFSQKQLADCERFIAHSREEMKDIPHAENVHFAIVDAEDTYMGTVSLKDIDHTKRNAEFAITVRKTAMGKGYSRYGMQEILKYGINELDLDCIYWCVNEANQRAVRYYHKNGYTLYEEKDPVILERYKGIMDSGAVLKWYKITR
jgi:RimJ/RimL family protein N-acetyltransferase